MSPEKLDELIRRIQKNEVEVLELLGVDISDADAEALVEALKTNHSVQTIDIRCTRIGDASAAALAEALKQPGCSIKALDLRHAQIGYFAFVALAEALNQPSCSIKALYLGYTQIGDNGAIALAEALKQPDCSIQALDLQDNEIGSVGVAALAKALMANSSLQTLNLSCNFIREAGAVEVAEALKQPGCSIQVLNLNASELYNRSSLIGMRSAGVAALAKALKTNRSVQTLSLLYNKIGDNGAIELAEALKQPGCSIKALDLRFNLIEDAGVAALAEALETNRSVEKLNIEGNLIGDAGVAQKIKKELEANLFLNSLPTLGAAPRNFLEYQERCSTLRDIFFQTRAKYGISMSGQSSESVPNKILNFLSELEGEMCGTYGAFEDLLAESKDATITEKNTAFRATIDMLQCLLKPGEHFRPHFRF